MSETDRERAMRIWKAAFGDHKWACDCFGTRIFRDDYGDHDGYRLDPDGSGKKHKYGWDIDHIRPKADYVRQGGKESDADFIDNLEPEHFENNHEKGESYPHFTIGDRKFAVVDCGVCRRNGTKGYGILDLATNERIDWKWKTDQCFK